MSDIDTRSPFTLSELDKILKIQAGVKIKPDEVDLFERICFWAGRAPGLLSDARALRKEIEQLKKDVEHHRQEVGLLMMRNSALQDVIVKWQDGKALKVVETKEGA